MTKEEHQQRHIELYQALDELLADWLSQDKQPFDMQKRRSIHSPILDLMKWSREQTNFADRKKRLTRKRKTGTIRKKSQKSSQTDFSQIYGEAINRGTYKDISSDVAEVIGHELEGEFAGDGWKQWTPKEKQTQ